jgi:hypothetical protein
MRRLLLALLIVAVAVGADFAAARVFERRVTTALEREYQLGDRPVVQVRDVPFLPHLLTGRFSGIDLAASDARARGITLTSVEVRLREVRVPRAVLLGRHGVVRVDRAEGQVELSQDQINQLLRDRLQGGSVAIDANGVRLRVDTQVLGQRVQAVVVGRLGVRTGRMTFQPESVEVGGVRNQVLEAALLSRFSFAVPLPPLPADIEVERVDTGPGMVALVGRATAVEVAV